MASVKVGPPYPAVSGGCSGSGWWPGALFRMIRRAASESDRFVQSSDEAE
jgi:hypothetical protein